MTTLKQDDEIRELLEESKVVAVIGHSDKPFRTSYQIAKYMQRAGYRIYPVNPMVDQIDGEKSYASLADVPEPIDIVDVFRRSEHLDQIVADSIDVGAKSVWTQLGVVDPKAEERANKSEMPIVIDRCIKVEHRRLGLGGS
jgi:hypothetical protein